MHKHGLNHDLDTLLRQAADRRASLRWLFAGAALPLLGCGGGSNSATAVTSSAATPVAAAPASSTGTTTTGSSTSTAGCAVIPEETGGPYPGDGTNSTASGVANALILAGVVRQDIRSSFAGSTGSAAGIALTVKLQLVNVSASCASLAGAAVYLWHCDRDGNYSMYSSGLTNQNYLRGVQAADEQGVVSFTTIFPGCYSGRMPHIHFEVYPSLAKAGNAANRIKTSQFSFPTSTMNEAYATAGYSASVRNLAAISFATDNVFNDGTSLQIVSISGDAVNGYVASLTVGVNA